MTKQSIFVIALLLAVMSVNLRSQELDTQLALTAIKTEQFKIIGSAKFTVLFWDIYESQLLTTSGKFPVNAKQEKVLFEINYLRDIRAQELIERTIEQWQHIGLETKDYQHYVPQLARLWPDISRGDKLSLLIEGSRSSFYFNDQHIGDIVHDRFGQQFIDIWLSPNTSEPTLRRKLLGEVKNESLI